MKKGDKYDGIRIATAAFLLAVIAAGIVWLGIPVVGQLVFVAAFFLVIYGGYLHLSAMSKHNRKGR